MLIDECIALNRQLNKTIDQLTLQNMELRCKVARLATENVIMFAEANPEAWLEFLIDNRELVEELKEKLKETHGMASASQPVEGD